MRPKNTNWCIMQIQTNALFWKANAEKFYFPEAEEQSFVAVLYLFSGDKKLAKEKNLSSDCLNTMMLITLISPLGE